MCMCVWSGELYTTGLLSTGVLRYALKTAVVSELQLQRHSVLSLVQCVSHTATWFSVELLIQTLHSELRAQKWKQSGCLRGLREVCELAYYLLAFLPAASSSLSHYKLSTKPLSYPCLHFGLWSAW